MSLSLQACGGRAGPAFEPPRTPTLRYQAKMVELSVLDERGERSAEREIDTPVLSLPGQKIQRQLPLDPGLASVLQMQLPALLAAGASDSLRFDLHVQEAQAGFRATWIQEIAFTRVRIRVCVLDSKDYVPLSSGWAESWAEVSSIDVADDEPARLLDVAVVAAFRHFVSDDAAIRATNQALSLRRRGGTLLGVDPSCAPRSLAADANHGVRGAVVEPAAGVAD